MDDIRYNTSDIATKYGKGKMIEFDKINITEGYIARHTPVGSGAPGREAAIIDIAQDLLLSYLEDNGFMNEVCLKGGTAIRKFYAGREGRFSLDLDFSVDDINVSSDERAFDFVSTIDGLSIGPFTYSISERRNKWYIGLTSPFNEGEIYRTKLDFASLPWLKPVKRDIIPLPIHKQYGFVMPAINTIRLEENMAEKIARLNRTSTARDMYDLNWIMENKPLADTLDKDLLRRLVVLKIWVDSYGMHCGNIFYRPAHEPSVFDPDRWLNGRNEKNINEEDIGTLAVPAPTARQMIDGLKENYQFLMDLNDTEKAIAISSQKDRSLVIHELSELPDGRLTGGLY